MEVTLSLAKILIIRCGEDLIGEWPQQNFLLARGAIHGIV